MPRIRLIHWNAAEAAERATRLANDEIRVDHAPLDPSGLRALRAEPPDAVVIDLGRLPSHGRDLGAALRQSSSTRGIPLVFVDGDPAKVARLRELLPDAVYADWSGIHEALAYALAHPPTKPVDPRLEHGWILGHAAAAQSWASSRGTRWRWWARPTTSSACWASLPPDVTLSPARAGPLRPHRLVRRLRAAISSGASRATGLKAGAGGLWICWPKKASGVVSDLSERVVRETGLAHGLVDYKIASIDQTWSGLRFTRRKTR